MVGQLIDWIIECSVYWLIGQLISWSVDGLVNWLLGSQALSKKLRNMVQLDFQIWTKLNVEGRADPGLACAHELVALCELIHPGLSVEGRLPGTKNVAQ